MPPPGQRTAAADPVRSATRRLPQERRRFRFLCAAGWCLVRPAGHRGL